MNCPLVSVLLPAYNASRYLAEAVQSVCDQTFTDWELLALDDGSSDSTLSILEDFARRDPRIRVFPRPHAGILAVLNDGLALARGEFLARMDSDDISLPSRFAEQVRFLREHPDLSIVGSRVIEMDPYGCRICVSAQPLDHEGIDAQLMIGAGWAIVHPSAMMRTEKVREVGGYTPAYQWSEDLDLYLRLAERGRVANIAEPLLMYRRHLSSVNYNKHEAQRQMKASIVGDAYRRRGLPVPELDFSHHRPPPRADMARRWGWSALRAGNVTAARQHAKDAVRHSPWSLQSWRLMACALRGH